MKWFIHTLNVVHDCSHGAAENIYSTKVQMKGSSKIIRAYRNLSLKQELNILQFRKRHSPVLPKSLPPPMQLHQPSMRHAPCPLLPDWKGPLRVSEGLLAYWGNPPSPPWDRLDLGVMVVVRETDT